MAVMDDPHIVGAASSEPTEVPTAQIETAASVEAENVRCPDCGGDGSKSWTTTKDDGGLGTILSLSNPSLGLAYNLTRETERHTAACATCGADGRITESHEGQILDRQNRGMMIGLVVVLSIVLLILVGMLLIGGPEAFNPDMSNLGSPSTV